LLHWGSKSFSHRPTFLPSFVTVLAVERLTLVAVSMQMAMFRTAERHGKFVTHLAAQDDLAPKF
jgi:hypothetical protein